MLLLAIFARSVGELYYLHTQHKQDFQPAKNILQPLQNEHTHEEIYFRFYVLPTTTHTPIYI